MFVLFCDHSYFIVGRDARLSSPDLSRALIAGVLSTGCDVIDIGIVPTPVVYFATHTLGSRSGVMLTGSHNPGNYNGLKIVLGGETLSEKSLQALYECTIAQDFAAGAGTLTETCLEQSYVDTVTQAVTLKKPLKIVVDAGNGVAGRLAPKVYEALGCDVTPLYCELDGRFPNHHPDPSVASNLAELIETVQKNKSGCGISV